MLADYIHFFTVRILFDTMLYWNNMNCVRKKYYTVVFLVIGWVNILYILYASSVFKIILK